MVLELVIVFWNNKMESTLWILNLYKLKDLHVVLVDFTGKSIRTDVDHINVWVFNRENPDNLCIFLLLKLLSAHSLKFTNWVRVDVDLCSLLLLDLRPASLEFFLHVTPYLTRLLIQLVYLLLGWFLELVKSVLSLNYSCLEHEELQVSKSWKCLMSSPASLNPDSCQHRSIWTFVLVLWIFENGNKSGGGWFHCHTVNFGSEMVEAL